MGKPILLFLDPPLDTNDAVGWNPYPEIEIVVGWGELVIYTGGQEMKFVCGIAEEGSADSEGHSMAHLITISPTYWQPLPEPPAKNRDRK